MTLLKRLTDTTLRYFGATPPTHRAKDTAGRRIDLGAYTYPSFCEQLGYRYYDDVDEMFHNRRNSGLMYELSPLTGANEQLTSQLHQLLMDKVRHDLTVTVIRLTSRQVGGHIDRFAEQFTADPQMSFDGLSAQMAAYYKQAAKAGFVTTNGVNAGLWDTRCFIVLDKANRQYTEREMSTALARFRQTFEASLTAMQLGYRRADPLDLLHIAQSLVATDPNSIYPETIHYDETQPLHHQVVDRSFECDASHSDHLIMRLTNQNNQQVESLVTVLSLSDRLPREFHLGQTIDCDNNLLEKHKSIQCPHAVVMVYSEEDVKKTKSTARRKTKDLKKKSNSEYAEQDPTVEDTASNWAAHRKDVEKGSTRTVHCLYNVILYSKADERLNDVAMAQETYATIGLKLLIANHIQLPTLLASLPFMFTAETEPGFRLPTMMLALSSWCAVQYLPLLADWHGLKRGILLPSARGQFSLFDPHNDRFGTNYNATISGTSGGGKSFFMQSLILYTLSQGGDAMVLDIGGSYKKTCEAVGGTYIDYHSLTMNPFTHVTDILADIDMLRDLFEVLACPRKQASDDDAGTLRDAILQAFEHAGNATTIDDVQRALRDLYSNDQEAYPSARLLAKNLSPYTTKAEHGRVFNAPSTLNPDARLIVVDLDDIKDKPAVRLPVLVAVFAQFRRRIYSSERTRRKLCIIDEAWKFFKGEPIAAQFIVEGFRTGRRYNAAYMTVTQGLADYHDFAEARAAWDNSALKFVFKQANDALDDYQQAHTTLNELEYQAVKGFVKAKHARYSQVLVKFEGGSSVHNLFVDPVSLVMQSSAGDDFEAVDALRKTGVAHHDALVQVARAHYPELFEREALMSKGV